MRKVVNFLLIGILGFGLLAFAQQEVPPGRIVIEFWLPSAERWVI